MAGAGWGVEDLDSEPNDYVGYSGPSPSGPRHKPSELGLLFFDNHPDGIQRPTRSFCDPHSDASWLERRNIRYDSANPHVSTRQDLSQRYVRPWSLQELDQCSEKVSFGDGPPVARPQ